MPVARAATIALAALLFASACGVAEPDGRVEVASTATREATRPTSSAPAAAEWWVPAPDSSWQWQLAGPVNTAYDVDVYDIDLFDSDRDLIAGLRAEGRRVICYFSAGSAEDWREDFEQFAPEDIGEPLDGWEGERRVDIRSPEVRAVMLSRLDLAREKGCDAVEPDNVQSYENESGFALSAGDQLAYNRFIAAEAHARGLAVGLKNGGAQAAELVDAYDFALNEECHAYDECEDFAPFIAAGKAVFSVEYPGSLDAARELAEEVCPRANAAGLRTLLPPLELDDVFRIACFAEAWAAWAGANEPRLPGRTATRR